jgi:hypothetical protein
VGLGEPRALKLFIFIAVAMAGFYFVPSVTDGGGTPCEALVRRALISKPIYDDRGKTDQLASGMILVLGPMVASRAMAERYPGVPPQVTCAGVWWLMVSATQSPQDYPAQSR